MQGLKGKTAVITGGGTGIGLGIAKVLASHGMHLVLAQIDLEQAQAAANLLPSAMAIEADVADRTSVDRMVVCAVERFGAIQVLVNNAAISGRSALSPFLECSTADLDRILEVNLKGVFHCSQAVARHMAKNNIAGSIVHISSVGAFAAQEFASVYCAAKAGVTSLAQSMALELAPLGIRVNCVAPGDIETDTSRHIVAELKTSGASGRYLRRTPAGRRGTPEDIGHAVAYLASDEASFVTGATLRVDGGFLCY